MFLIERNYYTTDDIFEGTLFMIVVVFFYFCFVRIYHISHLGKKIVLCTLLVLFLVNSYFFFAVL